MALKKQVFAELDAIAQPDAILASNTSTLDIDEIASATVAAAAGDRPPLLQPGQRHAAAGDRARQSRPAREVIATSMDAGQEAGQGRRAGRQLPRLRRQPHVRPLPARGAVPGRGRRAASSRSTRRSTISAWRWGRWPSAIWPASTWAGASARSTATSKPPASASRLADDRLCELGRYGQKTGAAGIATTRTARPIARPRGRSPDRRGSAARAGISARTISADEIVERCIYALVNEGARILEEGMPCGRRHRHHLHQRLRLPRLPRRADVVRRHGRARKRCYERISEFHEHHGELWEPAPLLKRLAEEGKTFAATANNKLQPRTASARKLGQRPTSNEERSDERSRRLLTVSRTPLAKSFRGSFNLTRPDDLAAHCIREVLSKTSATRSRRNRRRDPRAAASRTERRATTSRGCRRCLAGLPVSDGRHDRQSLLLFGPAGHRHGRPPDHQRRRRAAIGGGVEVDHVIVRDNDPSTPWSRSNIRASTW